MKTVRVGKGKSGVADGGKGGGMRDLEGDVDFLAGEGKTGRSEDNGPTFFFLKIVEMRKMYYLWGKKYCWGRGGFLHRRTLDILRLQSFPRCIIVFTMLGFADGITSFNLSAYETDSHFSLLTGREM